MAIISLIVLLLIAVALVAVGVHNARRSERRRRHEPQQRIDLFHKDVPGDPPA